MLSFRRIIASLEAEEDREFVTGIWPPKFERILNGGEKLCQKPALKCPCFL